MERAKTINKSKFLEKEECNTLSFPTVLNSDNSTLFDIANLIGVDLGVSLEMAEQNID